MAGESAKGKRGGKAESRSCRISSSTGDQRDALIMPAEAAGPQDRAVPEARGSGNAGTALPPQLPGAPGEAAWHCQQFSLFICQVF